MEWVAYLAQSIITATTGDVSYLYITNLGGSNPYNGLPSYITSEARDVGWVRDFSSGGSSFNTIRRLSFVPKIKTAAAFANPIDP